MNKFFIKFFVNAAGLLIVSRIIKGVVIDGLDTLVVAALVLGFVNSFLRPLLLFLTLPFNFFSLGFFTFIINAFIFYLVSRLVKGFSVANFSGAFWGALCLSAITFIMELFIKPKTVKISGVYSRGRQSGRGHKFKDVIDVSPVEEKDD